MSSVYAMTRKRNLLEEYLDKIDKKTNKEWKKGKAGSNRSKLVGQMNSTETAYAEWLAGRKILEEVIAFKIRSFWLTTCRQFMV